MKVSALSRRILSGLAAAVIFGSLPAFSCASAAKNADIPEYYPIDISGIDIPSYSSYYDKHSGSKIPAESIVIRGKDYDTAKYGTFSTGSFTGGDELRSGVLSWESPEGEISYSVYVPETGLYSVNMEYCPMKSDSTDIELELRIDGELPFESAGRLKLDRVWVSEREIYTDKRGNQVRPPQVQKEMWCSCNIGDPDGLFGDPLLFFMEKGLHQLTLSSERAQFALDRITLAPPEKLPEYKEYRSSVKADKDAGSDNSLIRIEGEAAAFKSDATLYPTYDNSSYLVSPSDPVKMVYNTLGAGNWKKPLQSVTWVVPQEEIGNGGWFRIGIKARQNQLRGLYSNRRLYIDGNVPCRELDQVKFPFDNDWYLVTPKTDKGEDILVYLDGGSDHTLTMQCVPGEIGGSLRRLEECIRELNGCYRKILMITGPAPDKYTDYYVHEKIPGLTDDLSRLSTELKNIQQEIESLAGSSGSEAAALENMAVILDKCTAHPLRIPDYLKQIKDSLASLSAWERSCRDQPLEVDYIELASADTHFSGVKEKFFKKVSFAVRSFFGSFFEDYTSLSDSDDKDALEVWVSLGRDQAQVVKELVENEFVPQYGIPVSVNLVNGGVVEASLAGKGPDVALFLGGEFPVNLAARGLIADISDEQQFPGFSSVRSRFQQNAMTQYTYNGGVYGVPISQSFPMLFYRTDILSELGFTSPPETWQQLTDMLPALQRNYMSVGLVLPGADISPATEVGHTFALLMLQKGMNYYNSDNSASVFSSIEAVQSFEQWTDFYREYSFEQTYDPFSRFRTGEYPMLIANYTFFNQLAAAAPEIKGLWDFCPVPGTPQPDGSVSHAANSAGAGAVIFNKVRDKESAWKFVSWFTDADTQVRFASQIEGLMGTMGRFDTANTEALSRLSWSDSEYRRLAAQQSELAEIPVLPSSYAVTRNIMNAFREVVNEQENPRDTLIWYDRDINEEIARKRQELREPST